MPASWDNSWRTDRSSPAWRALRRIRCAICRARTQVKTWTRMLWSVQWYMGENETTCGSFSCRKENSASDWDRYPAMTSAAGQSSWLVISTCLPKISSSSSARAAGSADQERRRSLGWSPVSSQRMTRRIHGLAVTCSISACTFSRGRRTGVFGAQVVAERGSGAVSVDENWRMHADPELTAAWTPAQLGSVLVHHVCHLLRTHGERAQ